MSRLLIALCTCGFESVTRRLYILKYNVRFACHSSFALILAKLSNNKTYIQGLIKGYTRAFTNQSHTAVKAKLIASILLSNQLKQFITNAHTAPQTGHIYMQKTLLLAHFCSHSVTHLEARACAHGLIKYIITITHSLQYLLH